jgi:hypothetical protein
VNLIWHGFEHVLQEFPSRLSVRLLDELGHGKLALAIDANEQEKLSFSSLNLSDVDVKEADRVAFEVRRLWLVGKRPAWPPLRCSFPR